MPIPGVWRIQDAVAKRMNQDYLARVNAFRAAQLSKEDFEDHLRKVTTHE